METGEIKVIVSDGTTAETQIPNQPLNSVKTISQVPNPNTQDADISRVARKSTNVVVKQAAEESASSLVSAMYLFGVAKQAANTALSNVGRYSGNSLLQTQVNNAVQGIGLGISAYMHPLATAVSVGFGITQTVLNENFRQSQEQMQLSISRARNGYTDAKSILTSRRH